MGNLPLTTEPFLTGKPLEAWLDSMGITNWSINDGLVDVKGAVNLYGRLGELKRLPVKFGKVGHFSCGHNKLVSLEGAPEKVGGYFWCHANQLVSLNGSPEKVGGNFWCHANQLVSLEGAPNKVGGDFWCNHSQLESLEGAPQKVVGAFACHDNQLVSLEGAPKQVGGDFRCHANQLVSLEGAPNKVGGDFWCEHNLLVDFKGMEAVSIAGNLFATNQEEPGQDNVFVSLEGLPKALYRQVIGFDIASLLDSQHSDIPDIEI